MNSRASLRINVLSAILTIVIITSINIQAQQDKWDYFDPTPV